MRLIRLTILATATLLLAVSCDKQTPIDEQPQSEIAVTYYSIEGCWQLRLLDGAELHEGTLLYVRFSRSEPHFELWENIGSMYTRKTTGTYTITKEEDGSYWLGGSYDSGMGDWNEEYRVEMPSNEEMVWWATNCLEFKRVESIPEYNQ